MAQGSREWKLFTEKDSMWTVYLLINKQEAYRGNSVRKRGWTLFSYLLICKTRERTRLELHGEGMKP
jgi:hypothetical protein